VFSFARANNNVRIKTVTGAAKRFLEQHQHDFAVLDVELNNMLGAVENAKRTEGRLFVEMMKSLVVGDAYFEARGHSPRSFELLRAACVKAKELGELEAAHHLITKMGNTYREFYGNLDKALEAYQEALGLAQRLGNRHREAIMLSLMGVVHFQKHEDASKAYTYLEKARYLAGICGEDLTINRVLQNMSFVAGATGDHEKALTFCLEAVEAAYSFKSNSLVQKVEVDHNLFFSLLNLGVAERHLDQLESSLKTYMRALAVAQEHNNQVWMAYALQEIGETHHQVANQQLAQENYDKALELYWRNNAATDIESLTELMRKQGYQLRESYFPRQG
jgi:tetratricopeptide (TPR) repeat protein